MEGDADVSGWSVEARGDDLCLVRNGSPYRLRGRERSLYIALVALKGVRDLEPEDLACMPDWAGISALARGKEISRRLRVAGKPHGECIYSPPKGKTSSWTLADNVVITEGASAMAARSWSEAERASRTHAALSDAELAGWFASEAAALMAITSAHIADADRENTVGGTIVANAPDLKTIAHFVDIRVRQLRGTPFVGYRRDETGTRVSVEVARRLFAIEALGGGDKRRRIDLARIRATLSVTVDLTTRAWLHNAACVLLRREGDLKGSVSAGRAAAPLAILSNDFVLIQAVAFNLALALALSSKTGPDPNDPHRIYRLLQVDRDFRRLFNLGRDSAQCELGLAAWHLRLGDLECAAAMLDEAKALVRFERPSIDRALYWRRCAELAIRSNRALDVSEVSELLGRAEADYRAIDRLAGVEAVNALRAELALRQKA